MLFFLKRNSQIILFIQNNVYSTTIYKRVDR